MHFRSRHFLLSLFIPASAVVRGWILSFLLLPLSATGQSLEAKVAEFKRIQAANAFPGDTLALDTIGLPNGFSRSGKRPGKERRRPSLPSDSLLSWPRINDSLGEDVRIDSVWVRDSTGKLVARPETTLIVPKRYEQRVFRSYNPTAFSSASGAAGRSYILGPGDEITVSVWGDREKEYHLQLNPEGKIFLEGAGVVPLAGDNLDQALQALKRRLSKIYSGVGRGTTFLDVTLEQAGPIRVFLLGDVKVPGGYVFTGNTSILSALYFAKGPNDLGSVRDLQLTRGGKKFTLDLYKYLLEGEPVSPQVLQDGDVIFCPRAEALVTIDGDVGRPAIYELKQGEGVKELLSFAGGVNPTAADQRMVLNRLFPDGRIDFIDLASPSDFMAGKAAMELKDGDRLIVRKSTEKSRNFIVITGPVKYPGTYEATGVTSVAQLVEKAGGLREDAYLGRVHVVRLNPNGSSSLMAFSLDSISTGDIPLQPRDNVILYSLKEMYLPDSVRIEGAVFRPGTFEYRSGTTVKDLVMQAGGYLPHHESGRLLVFRGDVHDRKVEQIQLDVSDGLDKNGNGFGLKPGDLVQVPIDPRWYQKEVVSLEGQFMHPGKYALLFPGERLASVIHRAGGFKENAYAQGGRFFRSRDSIGRIGVDIITAIGSPGDKANISLAGGDSIFIPERQNTVKVIGEVGFETSVLYQPGSTVQYYIEKAGGFTRRSERDRVVVQYANGETSRDGYFNRKPDAGSVIYVPQGPEPKPIDWVSGLNAILGTAGVVVALVLSIQALSK